VDQKNTIERFGPVRSVEHEHVFEIAFEGIAESKRHKSGIATRFPRILRWRQDKKIEDANTLEDLKAMIPE
jgi:DNA ligase-1